MEGISRPLRALIKTTHTHTHIHGDLFSWIFIVSLYHFGGEVPGQIDREFRKRNGSVTKVQGEVQTQNVKALQANTDTTPHTL